MHLKSTLLYFIYEYKITDYIKTHLKLLYTAYILSINLLSQAKAQHLYYNIFAQGEDIQYHAPYHEPNTKKHKIEHLYNKNKK